MATFCTILQALSMKYHNFYLFYHFVIFVISVLVFIFVPTMSVLIGIFIVISRPSLISMIFLLIDISTVVSQSISAIWPVLYHENYTCHKIYHYHWNFYPCICLYNDLYIFSYFHGPEMYDNTLFHNYFCNILVIYPFCMISFCHSIFAICPCYRIYLFHSDFMFYPYCMIYLFHILFLQSASVCHLYLYKNFLLPLCSLFACAPVFCSLFSFVLFSCLSWLVATGIANSSLSKWLNTILK